MKQLRVESNRALETAYRSTGSRAAELAQLLVPGMYAWAVTVLPVVLQGQTIGVWISGIAAPVLIICGGVALVRTHRKLGYILGIWGFVGACTTSWLQGAWLLEVQRIDFWRAASGSIGWVLFALGWSVPWKIGSHPEDNARARIFPVLKPHRPLSKIPALAALIATTGSLTCLMLAWRASDSSRALLVHGIAIVCAVSMLYATAIVGVLQGNRRRPETAKARAGFALPWLFALALLAIVAVIWTIGIRG